MLSRFFKSQKFRYIVLTKLSWVPNSIMLRLQYYYTLRRYLHLSNPKRFTEWIQFYKAYYRNPTMLQCVDKYEVRNYLIQKGYLRILNKLYQVCDRAEDINFEQLPQKFVVKSTNGGNGDNILIVRDKSTLDKQKTIKEINLWLSKNYSQISREWAYLNASKRPRIIVEEYLENSMQNHDLDDFKFLCFNGEFKYLWVDKDRYSNHKRGFWDNSFNFLPEIVSDHPTFIHPPELPNNIDEMAKIAECISKDFPFVRVDLYNINGKIYFGELTFYPWSGYVQFNPDSFDFTLGDLFNLKYLS